MAKVGKYIRIKRNKRGLSQEELAEKLFVSRQTVSNYENGRSNPDIDMLVKIAEVLETDVQTLIYGENAIKEKNVFDKQYFLIDIAACGIIYGITWALVYLIRSMNHLEIIYESVAPNYAISIGLVILHILVHLVFGAYTKRKDYREKIKNGCVANVLEAVIFAAIVHILSKFECFFLFPRFYATLFCLLIMSVEIFAACYQTVYIKK
ncbi:MAG: helix-turn-helix domain-containing protein [Lachnospiraceae bacterium]|nr:helix-turn-helix domain-containing protein [Lachnospiraceae bacterium]